MTNYTENVVFPSRSNQQAMVGKSFTFSWKIEDGKWHHQGTLKSATPGRKIHEIWERIPETMILIPEFNR